MADKSCLGHITVLGMRGSLFSREYNIVSCLRRK